MDEKYIPLSAAVAIIEAKQRELCPVGRFSRNAISGTDRERFDELQESIDAIEAIEPADVRPVVRGHFGKHISPFTAPCSECGASMNMQWNYCPNCGADMRPEPPEREVGA